MKFLPQQSPTGEFDIFVIDFEFLRMNHFKLCDDYRWYADLVNCTEFLFAYLLRKLVLKSIILIHYNNFI